MDQKKVGELIRDLRKERALTQEQIAEQFGVSRRTVSRWETGSNMPDLDILVEMADFYDVDIREILTGERKSIKMDEELKDTVLKVVEFSNEEKKKQARIVLIYFLLGIICLGAHLVLEFFDLPSTFMVGFVEGLTLSFGLLSMVLGVLYITGILDKVFAAKRRLLNKDRQETL